MACLWMTPGVDYFAWVTSSQRGKDPTEESRLPWHVPGDKKMRGNVSSQAFCDWNTGRWHVSVVELDIRPARYHLPLQDRSFSPYTPPYRGKARCDVQEHRRHSVPPSLLILPALPHHARDVRDATIAFLGLVLVRSNAPHVGYTMGYGLTTFSINEMNIDLLMII